MKLVSALVGLAALGGVALSSAAASAQTSTSVVVPAGYVCNEWGHCWPRHHYNEGYYHPHYWGGYGYGGGYGWHRHNWHPHYWGSGWGGGYGWHHWHHWHQW